jgi:Tol biopolymer transport system component
MPLTIGTRLGPYEIQSALGAGGMGEVYKGRDTRLDRSVAIKILPAALAADSQFRDRFDREARAISQLDHPHICALYDVGEHTGTAYLVMQYLEGETLADRLTKGALPLDQALQVAIQIAGALAAAHKAGIVHRDLKPGNIMLTKSGAKLLDFGLAKTGASVLGGTNLSMLPTTPPITQQGSILGTFQYMAPEQIEGKDADARTDLFAFGAVLYEILTGRKAFEGKTQATLIAAIIGSNPPPVTQVRPAAPATLNRIVATCLAKDPDDRWQSARDLMRELQWIAEAPAQVAEPTLSVAGRKGRFGGARLAWSLLVVAGIAALTLMTVTYIRRAPVDTRVYRSTILAALTSNPNTESILSLSPDGHQLAFIGSDANGNQLVYVRALDGLTAHPLAGTEGAATLFWSPDGRFLAFAAGNKLKTIDAAGNSSPVVLCESLAALPGSWNRDGVILFTPTGGPLFRVSSAGGKPSPVTSLDTKLGETAHTYPYFLPDGRHFLYLAQASGGVPHGVYIGSLDSTERKRLLDGGSNAQYAQGALVFLRGTTLVAQPFDVSRLALTGEPVPLADGVQVSEVSAVLRTGTFSVSETGALVYRADGSGGSELVWFDRSGHEVGRLGDRAKYLDVVLSPDGSRASVSVLEPGTATRDVWIYDVARGLRNRGTFDPEDDLDAKWSPEGSRIVFGSRRRGHLDLYVKAASGADTEQLLWADDLDKYPQSWSPDGRFLLYVTVGGPAGQDLWVLPMTGDERKPFPFLRTRFNKGTGQFSPDGRWIVYRSNDTGRFEIYVAPFPGPGGKWQVSTMGGSVPRWRGNEIFYVAPGNTLMVAAVAVDGARLDVGPVKKLFQARPVTPRYFFDVSPDGQRLLVNTADEPAGSVPLTLVVNWTAALKK